MPDINWPEVLVALVLSVVVTELGGWLPRLAEMLVRAVARQLPARADRRETEWLDTLDATPGQWSKLFRALTCLYALIAILRHTPKRGEVELRGSRGLRLLLGWTRLQALLLFLAVALIDGTWLLFGAFSSSPVPVLGLLQLHLLAAFLYLLNWRGLGVDWPWLRTTPQGSAVLLALGTWPFMYLPLTGHAPPTALGAIWIVTLHILWAWEGYWATTRPLRKRGLLAWTKAKPQ